MRRRVAAFLVLDHRGSGGDARCSDRCGTTTLFSAGRGGGGGGGGRGRGNFKQAVFDFVGFCRWACSMLPTSNCFPSSAPPPPHRGGGRGSVGCSS
jgi:hypothetical protein